MEAREPATLAPPQEKGAGSKAARKNGAESKRRRLEKPTGPRLAPATRKTLGAQATVAL
jgi:hypothetical protein